MRSTASPKDIQNASLVRPIFPSCESMNRSSCSKRDLPKAKIGRLAVASVTRAQDVPVTSKKLDF